MFIKKYISLRDFNFWSGATSTRNLLTGDELDVIEEILEEVYPDGLEEIELNDIFWFDDDFIAKCLGYKDSETMWEDRTR